MGFRMKGTKGTRRRVGGGARRKVSEKSDGPGRLTQMDTVNKVKSILMAPFDARDMGEATLFLGITIERDRGNKTIKLGQERLAVDIFFFTTIPLQAQPHRQHDTAMKAGCRVAPHGKRQTPRARSQSRSHRKRAHTAPGREARAHGKRHHAWRAGNT